MNSEQLSIVPCLGKDGWCRRFLSSLRLMALGASVLSRHVLTTARRSTHLLLDIQNVIWRKPVVLITILTGVLYVTAINPDLDLWEDNGHYIIVGKSLATGQGFKDIHLPDKPPFNIPIPMFPLFLAPIIYFFDYNLWPMKIAVALIGVGAVYLTYRFFKTLLDETQAILLTLLVALSPQIVSFSHQVMTEIPYLCLFLLASLYLTKYAAEDQWLTRTGFISSFVVAAACLTKTIGIVLVFAAIPYLLCESSTKKLQAIKKLSLLILLTAIVWLLFNYHLLKGSNYYIDYFFRASSSEIGTWDDFVARITTNRHMYIHVFPETILYLTYTMPLKIFRWLSGLLVVWGFLYCLFNKRTILEYYMLFYPIPLLLLPPSSLSNSERYLIPIIPVILYYFIQGLNQLILRISDFTNLIRDHAKIGTPRPTQDAVFRAARRVSLAVICTLILLNCVSTVRASILRTDREMFDFYEIGYEPYKGLAQWTKEHTDPKSTIVTRSAALYYFWSGRTVNWYPSVNTQANKDQIVKWLLTQKADYIVLDGLAIKTSASDQMIMDVVRQNPDSFQLVYKNGDNKLYRITGTPSPRRSQ
jgi:hypothetical protein